MAKEARAERLMIKARKDFNKIKVTHNVATGNKKDEVRDLVYKEGELDSLNKMKSLIGLPEIDLFDFEGEEERDVNAIKIFMKKFAKLWKYLFYKYSNSGYSVKTINNFNDLKA